MSLITKNHAKPNAWIVSSKDKGRKSIKSGKVFLENQSEFEIELYNPLQQCILAEIKLNGQPISKTGLVLKPGQRFYLDCFIEDKKKFNFITYGIDNESDAVNAISKNGLLEVFFYKEEVLKVDNWMSKFDRVILEKWYPTYYPYYNNFGNYGRFIGNDFIFNNSGYGNIGNSIQNNSHSNYLFNSTTLSSTTNSNSLETGRIEKGETSSQTFKSIDLDFESNYISSTIIQILPESVKPVELKNKKTNSNSVNSSEIIDLIKKLSDLNKAGILTDDEFSSKKSELLSKI